MEGGRRWREGGDGDRGREKGREKGRRWRAVCEGGRERERKGGREKGRRWRAVCEGERKGGREGERKEGDGGLCVRELTLSMSESICSVSMSCLRSSPCLAMILMDLRLSTSVVSMF